MDITKVNHKEECKYTFKVNDYYLTFYCAEDNSERPLLKFNTSLLAEKNNPIQGDYSKSCWIASLGFINDVKTEIREEKISLHIDIGTSIEDLPSEAPIEDIKHLILHYTTEESKNLLDSEEPSIYPTSTSEIIRSTHKGNDSYWYFTGSSSVNYSLCIRFLLGQNGIQISFGSSKIWHLTNGNVNEAKQAHLDIAENFMEHLDIYDSNVDDCSHLETGMLPIKPKEKEIFIYNDSDQGW